jgi:hypothetical protein
VLAAIGEMDFQDFGFLVYGDVGGRDGRHESFQVDYANEYGKRRMCSRAARRSLQCIIQSREYAVAQVGIQVREPAGAAK